MTKKNLLWNWSQYATFPCKLNTKIPATKNGFKDAKFGQDVLKIFNQGYNVGLALSMSNLIAIDCDVDETKGYNGLKTLTAKENELGKLPKTLTQTTPRGGKHYIFSTKGIINPIGKIGKDVDIKHNGYIMIMPSKINGRDYIINDGYDENLDFTIAELPKAWLDYLNKDTDHSENHVRATKFAFEKSVIYRNIDIEKMFNNCNFLSNCRDNADILSEPEWFSMISVLAQIDNSDDLIHKLSEPYPTYSYAETQKKIDNARKFSYPQSCKYISENYPEICGNCNNATKKEVFNYDRHKQPK